MAITLFIIALATFIISFFSLVWVSNKTSGYDPNRGRHMEALASCGITLCVGLTFSLLL